MFIAERNFKWFLQRIFLTWNQFGFKTISTTNFKWFLQRIFLTWNQYGFKTISTTKGVCLLLHFMHKGAVLPHRKRYSVTFWSRGVFWGAESESGRIFLIPPPWGRIQGGEGGGDKGDFTKLTYNHV